MGNSFYKRHYEKPCKYSDFIPNFITVLLKPTSHHANLREDSYGEDDYPRSRTFRQHRKRQGQDPRQRRHSPGSATTHLRRETTGRRTHVVRLQHPEGVDASSRPAIERRNADLRQNPHGENHHPRGRAKRFHRKCQGQDPRQRGNPSRSAAFDLRRKAVGRWSHSVRLQHPERVDPPSRPSSSRWTVTGTFQPALSRWP